MKNTLTVIFTLIFGSFNTIAQAQNDVNFTNFSTDNGLPDNYVRGGVVVDQNNIKWFGTASGLAKYNDTTFTTYTTADGLVDNSINCLEVDASNQIWVGTDNGVSRFDGTTWTTFTSTDGLIDNSVVYLKTGLDRSMWIATGNGVSKYLDGIWTNYNTGNGLITNSINTISIDSTGNVWLGSLMEGAIMFDGTHFTSLTTTNQLADNNVFAIGVDNQNQKWIGTYMGVSVFNANNEFVTTYNKDNALHDNFVVDIIMDSKNRILVGEFADYNNEGGISFFDGTNWHFYTIADGLVDMQIKRMALDQSGVVWIATGNGVSKLSIHVGIEELALKNCEVFPNPTQNKLFVRAQNADIMTFELYNIGGQMLQKSVFKMSEVIDLSGLEKGIYHVRISDQKSSSVYKIIKQ